MDPSKFHFHSFGTVAANKPRGTDMAEIFPKEVFTMSAGEITDSVDEIDVKGKDASGQDYQGKLKTKPSMTCKWLPIGDPNRITAPDIRRGEEVLIYRYADTSYYFWTNAFNNIIRKLETAVWWYSGTPEEGKSSETERTADNGYFVEISSHEKHIILSTSNKNGEVVRYYMQFNMAEGNFILKDDLGQEVVIDSVEGIMEVTTEKEIIHNTKKYTINCEEYILNCKTSVVNAENSATTNTKDFTVNASGGTMFKTPKTQFTGTVTADGLLTYKSGMKGSGGAGGASAEITGAVKVTGGDITSDGISLKNHTHPGDSGGTTGKPK